MAMDDDSKGEPESPGSDDSGMDPLGQPPPPLRGESHPRLPQPYRMDRSRVNPRMPSLAILPMRARRGAGGAAFPAAPLPSGRPSSQRIAVPADWTRAHDADELESARPASSAAASSASAVAAVPSLADQERFQVSLEIERRFRALLRSRLGFQIEPQAEDGNCMFRSVAHQVYGDPELHRMVRAACMQYMTVERAFFREFIAGESFEQYIDRMKCDGEWGDNVELQAMSEIYERPIEIYAYSDKPLKTFMSAAASSAAAAGAAAGASSAAASSSSSSVPARAPAVPIRLSYHFASHYNSVIHPLHHRLAFQAAPAPGIMEQEALARVTRMRRMMDEQQRAAQAAAAASSSAAAAAAASSSSSSDLPGSLASSRSAFSSFQSGLASNPSGFDAAVAASLGELDAAFESEVSQAQQQSLAAREAEEAQMLDAACAQSERDDLDHAITEATRVSTSAAAAAQPQPSSSSSAAASSAAAAAASASSSAAAAAASASPAPGAKKPGPSVEEEVLQRALAASLAAAPLQPSEEEQLAQAMRMSVAAAEAAEAAAAAASPSSASAAAAAAAADSGLQSALRASLGESAQLPRSVQACMEFGFTLEAAVQAYELCNTPQAQQAGVSADAAHDLLVQRMMDYLCNS